MSKSIISTIPLAKATYEQIEKKSVYTKPVIEIFYVKAESAFTVASQPVKVNTSNMYYEDYDDQDINGGDIQLH
ncbi:MAG: hypothetical protein QM654_03290 [Dysgonamonadaceae bacterium]